jgi:VanZ family protein
MIRFTSPTVMNSPEPRRWRAIALSWGPAVIWMAVIFLFSTDYFSSANTTPLFAPILSRLFPDASAARIEQIIELTRKLGHYSEYFFLAILLMRALNAEHWGRLAKRRLIWCIALATLYAASDEWHQAFVPSRTASPVDVMIDSFGAICGSLWFHARKRPNTSSRKLSGT